MVLTILSDCGGSGFLKILLFIKILINAIFTIVPIGLIIIISIDLTKAVIASDPDKMKEKANISVKRLIYAVILFSVPYIVSLFSDVVGTSEISYSYCLNNANIESINIIEAEEKALQEQEEEARRQKRLQEKAEDNNSDINVIKATGCDGVIYYENGIYYKPSSALVPQNGKKNTKGSELYGYNKYFFEDLKRFIADAEKAGYTISYSTSENGAWRSYERQQYFYNCYTTEKCNNGNLAAVPGTSNHGWGIASDLSYNGSSAAIKWAKENAGKYNLGYNVSSENWHIEPKGVNIKIDDSKVKKCL